MTEEQSTTKVELTVNSGTYVLSRHEDPENLAARIQGAVDSGGSFVAFETEEGREVKVLVTHDTQVALSAGGPQLDTAASTEAGDVLMGSEGWIGDEFDLEQAALSEHSDIVDR